MRGRLTFSREGERVRATLRGGSQALIVLYNGRWAARWPGVTIVTELHCAPGMCFTSFGSCILVPVWGDPTDTLGMLPLLMNRRSARWRTGT